MPVTRDQEFLKGTEFYEYHEELFGKFYDWVAQIVRGLRPKNVTDVGGGTGNFLIHLRQILPGVPLKLFEQDQGLMDEAERQFRQRGVRVMVDSGDVLDRRMLPKPSALVTCLNVTGYFRTDDMREFFSNINADCVVGNFLITEDNAELELGVQEGYRPVLKSYNRKTGRMVWGKSFVLYTLPYRVLVDAAAAAEYAIEVEYKYSDFKHERLIVFRRSI